MRLKKTDRAVLLLWQWRGCVVDRGARGELHGGGGGVLHRGRPGGGRVLHRAPGVGCWPSVLHRSSPCCHCTVLGSHHLLPAHHAAVLQWRRCWRACCRARRRCRLWWRRRYEGGVVVAVGVHHTGLAGSDNLVGGHAGRLLDRGHAGGRRLGGWRWALHSQRGRGRRHWRRTQGWWGCRVGHLHKFLYWKNFSKYLLYLVTRRGSRVGRGWCVGGGWMRVAGGRDAELVGDD